MKTAVELFYKSIYNYIKNVLPQVCGFDFPEGVVSMSGCAIMLYGHYDSTSQSRAPPTQRQH